ncbi:MAG: thioredoxin family protein [Bacteroidia bacterium]|nr:thioredoxin family protein [Bacteroidia bacterium]
MQKKSILFISIYILVSSCSTTKLGNTEFPVCGIISLRDLKKTDWFKTEYEKYKTDTSFKEFINLKNYNITIIGGNWCSDTRLQLPRFIKVIEECGYNKNSLKILFVDRKKQCENCKDSIEKYKITFIPLFIISDKFGDEKGRITESPQKSIESDILSIVKRR